MYKIKVVQVDYDSKRPNRVALEEDINKALVDVEGEVESISNWTPDSLRAALVVITYKVD